MQTTLALVAAMAAVSISSTAHADEFATSAPRLDSVLEQARKADKPVLLDFSTVW